MPSSGCGLEPRSSRKVMARCALLFGPVIVVDVSSASVEMEKSELSVVKLSCDGDRSIRHDTASTEVEDDGFDIFTSLLRLINSICLIKVTIARTVN